MKKVRISELPIDGELDGEIFSKDCRLLLSRGTRVDDYLFYRLADRERDYVYSDSPGLGTTILEPDEDRMVNLLIKIKRSLNDIYSATGLQQVVHQSVVQEMALGVGELFSDADALGPKDQEGVTAVTESLLEMFLRNRRRAVKLEHLKETDQYLYSHSIRTAVLFAKLIYDLVKDKERLVDLVSAALLHNIGMAGVPEDVWNHYSASFLSDFEVVKLHPLFSYDILKRMDGFSQEALEMVKCHHERVDGSGYPSGLKGDDVPIVAQYLNIADYFDAVTTDRERLPGMSLHRAIVKILGEGMTFYRFDVVDRFLKVIGLHPPGTLVELNSSEIALVVEENEKGPRLPKVSIVYNAKREMVDNPVTLDLSQSRELGIVGAF